MQKNTVKPEFRLDAFDCPHCQAYSSQKWLLSLQISGRSEAHIKDIAISVCQRCGESAVWKEDKNSWQVDEEYLQGSSPMPPNQQLPTLPTKGALIYPFSSLAPMPADDMPDDIKLDYNEARDIVTQSPRGAAALLRLCVQKLMIHLGEKGKNIDDDIKSLVSKGLPVDIQEALDSLRVIGNESVHPGEFNLNDDQDTALALFDLLNIIVERMITQPRKINEVYQRIPESKKKGIFSRDKKK